MRVEPIQKAEDSCISKMNDKQSNVVHQIRWIKISFILFVYKDFASSSNKFLFIKIKKTKNKKIGWIKIPV